MSFLRNGIFIAILAHGLIGASLVWDKVLLREPETRNLPAYIFWMGAMSALGVLLAVLGFRLPPPGIALLAFGTGALHLVAIYFYYAALKKGEATDALALMGGFSTAATALISLAFLAVPVARRELLGFLVMTAGGFVMFFTERLNLRRILPDVLAASAAFGLVNVLQKVVFNQTDFVPGYVLFTLGTFAASLCLLLPRSWRKQILRRSRESPPRSRFWYFVNRLAAGVGSFLVFYAISKANPAVVEAISAERYAIVFLGAFLVTRLKPSWLSENFGGWVLAGKVAATGLVAAGLVLLAQTVAD